MVVRRSGRVVTADGDAAPILARRDRRRLLAADTLADLELKQGRYKEALRALELLPDENDFRVQLRRGIIHDAQAQHVEAEKNFDAALSVAADSAERVQALEYLGHNALKRKASSR